MGTACGPSTCLSIPTVETVHSWQKLRPPKFYYGKSHFACSPANIPIKTSCWVPGDLFSTFFLVSREKGTNNSAEGNEMVFVKYRLPELWCSCTADVWSGWSRGEALTMYCVFGWSRRFFCVRCQDTLVTCCSSTSPTAIAARMMMRHQTKARLTHLSITRGKSEVGPPFWKHSRENT